MILSHKQIEEIAAAVTKDFNEFFFGKDADNERSTAQATPIDQFAKDYLGLSVSFAHLSSDGSLCGLTAYADTEYTIEEQGVKRTIPLKANQVLLDMSFIPPGQVHALCGKRRFTLAHECAHQILFGIQDSCFISRNASVYAYPLYGRTATNRYASRRSPVSVSRIPAVCPAQSTCMVSPGRCSKCMVAFVL